jgi:hypothetical protein
MALGSCGIRVVGIAPRFVATEGNAASAQDMTESVVGQTPLHGVWQRRASAPQLSSASLLERYEMALAKKKRVGKRTISAKQVRKTASGRKRRKSDGTQPSKTVTSTSSPAAS